MHTLTTTDDNGRPEVGLTVQTDSKATPEYAEDTYRLYLMEEGRVPMSLDGQSAALNSGQLLTLSPGERVEFHGKCVRWSCAFHHDFFCVRVMRNEVFCDGVVFNRLMGIPIVELPGGELAIAKNRFSELCHILQDDCVFKKEHLINTLRSLLLQAADCKIRFSLQNAPARPRAARVSRLVSRFQDLVEERYTEHLEISHYCELLGVTVSTLNRHVKKSWARPQNKSPRRDLP